ncbi:MAG TPA: DUF3786 domain-containing protein [Dissulfurispiraceae bacterium]|nr:DUF3786 domain-containing protein [Dissulfurispiraceae bacterium]
MNAVELYKKLPQKNCGQCPGKTCMPFALSVLRGESELSECPHLSVEDAALLKGQVTTSDWREELVLKLQEEVRRLSFPEVAAGLGAGVRDGSLVLKCLGREFVIGNSGDIRTAGHLTPWMKILLLHYIRTAGKAPPSDKWVSFSELKNGNLKAAAFKRECEDPLKELFKRNIRAVSDALAKLGATTAGDFPTDQAWRVDLIPKMPAVILYWPEDPEDNEFDASLKILFDASADKFLDVESLLFLLEGLVKNIEVLFSS